MKTLFSSGDVGGARALLPVISSCHKNNFPFAVMEHGIISKEMAEDWEKLSLKENHSKNEICDMLKSNKITVFVFTSSVKDNFSLTIARCAKELDIKVIHVLDNWNGYSKRMKSDGLSVFAPDFYTVMDPLALQEASDDGISDLTTVLTGHPALGDIGKEFSKWNSSKNKIFRYQSNFDPKKIFILYVSEPVKMDQGATLKNPDFRGYCEDDSLKLFCDSLQKYSESVQIAVRPHPREDFQEVNKLWETHKKKLSGRVLPLDKGRESLFYADGVAGMASILLYEGWLLGKPVLSLQPNLRDNTLRTLKKRAEVEFLEDQNLIPIGIENWIKKIETKNQKINWTEMNRHNSAAENIMKLINNCMKSNIDQKMTRFEPAVK